MNSLLYERLFQSSFDFWNIFCLESKSERMIFIKQCRSFWGRSIRHRCIFKHMSTCQRCLKEASSAPMSPIMTFPNSVSWVFRCSTDPSFFSLIPVLTILFCRGSRDSSSTRTEFWFSDNKEIAFCSSMISAFCLACV